MNQGYLTKSVCRDKMNIRAFIDMYGVGVGRTFFFTMTFADNIEKKDEASSMWNNLRTTIKREFGDFEYIMVWERQKRRSWHLHLLGTIPALRSLNQFNKFLENFSFLSSKSYGFRRLRWTYGDSARLASYLCKYLTKEACNREKGVRYVAYSRGWQRICRMPFAFVGGKGAEWRANCASLHDEFGSVFKIFYRTSGYETVRRAVLNRSSAVVSSWVKREGGGLMGHLMKMEQGYFPVKEVEFEPVFFHKQYMGYNERFIKYVYQPAG